MQIDKKMLEKAARLPDKELEELIYSVVTAAGGGKMRARAAAANTDKLKKKLETITDEDIKQILDSLDGAQIVKILALAKEKGVEKDG